MECKQLLVKFQSYRWLAIQATVIEHETVYIYHHTFDSFEDYAVYEYAVGCSTYRSTGFSNNSDAFPSVASLYPVGSFVTILYDPHRPYRSFTSKGLSFYQFIDEIWLLLISAGVFSVVTGMLGGSSIGLLGLGQVGARIFDVSVMLAVCLSWLGSSCLLIWIASLPFRN